MRLRYVKGARELIENHPELIYDNTTNKVVNIESFFPKQQPLHIEIGTGKGQFIYTLAKKFPDINFIGIEKFDSAIVKALYKLLEEPLDNLRLIRMDAVDLEHIFTEYSIQRIYLNFSDPWPKERHAKRRLTNPRFLKVYQSLLYNDGEVHFKTDNSDLFLYSLDVMKSYPMDMIVVDYDVHSHEHDDNIMTEFEEKFVQEGLQIHKIIARFKEENNG